MIQFEFKSNKKGLCPATEQKARFFVRTEANSDQEGSPSGDRANCWAKLKHAS
jgi:hypothetical protein